MNRGAWLLPNLGAEEHRLDRGSPIVGQRSAGRLWQMLFRAGSELLLDDTCVDASDWPTPLGPTPAEPAFRWLEDSGGGSMWLVDEDALATFAARGVVCRVPDPLVVRHVHDKAFALRTAAGHSMIPNVLDGFATVFDAEDLIDERAALQRLQAAVSSWPRWAANRFTLKPRRGCSGRGRVPGSIQRLDTPEIRGSMARFRQTGGFIVEAWLDRTVDLSAQFVVADDGNVTLLGTLEQVLSTSGSYFGHRGIITADGAISAGSADDSVLIETSHILVDTAARAGYFGPCGVDAFSFLDPQGSKGRPRQTYFRPALELNARFTLGTIAIGLIRRIIANRFIDDLRASGSAPAFFFGLRPPTAGWPNPDTLDQTRCRLVSLGEFDDRDCPALLITANRAALDKMLSRMHERPP